MIEVYGKEGKTILASFDVESGKPTDLTKGNQAVVRFRAPDDRSKIIYTVSTATRIGDLFAIDSAGGEPRQLTHINNELFSKLNLTEPEEIHYKTFDGKTIQAWVQKPPDFNPAKKYPLILNIHGGPHAAYGYIFAHEFQWMAAKGYVVLYPNPRGSTTYGQDFGNVIQFHYPGDDYKDLMAGVDEVIRRGYIDDKKLGVTGGSGGGLLTNWVVGQTNRFAAAVSQRDIASWGAWWYTADFTLFQPSWFKAPPFEDEQDFKARSPLTFIKNVKTPMMFILGEADYRTPPGAGGEEMFRALKFRKIPTVMVRFPNESHELSRSGQPWHRVERLQNIVGWFDRWLMGIPKPEYDVAPQEEVPGKKGNVARQTIDATSLRVAAIDRSCPLGLAERMASSSIWQRFQQYFLYYRDLDFSLDISRMKFPDDFFEKMQPKIEKAFAAMRELEGGAIANPTEKRMVGHYWLRNPRWRQTRKFAQRSKKQSSTSKGLRRMFTPEKSPLKMANASSIFSSSGLAARRSDPNSWRMPLDQRAIQWTSIFSTTPIRAVSIAFSTRSISIFRRRSSLWSPNPVGQRKREMECSKRKRNLKRKVSSSPNTPWL